jgi:phenylacetate-CoA ligase
MSSTIATFSEEIGIPLGGPEAVFTSSETLLESQRDLMEDVFRCRIFDGYGNSELCASIGQCERDKYHLNAEYGIVELDHDVRGKNGDTGQMICTSFVNHGIPLLRYRIGDLMRLSDSKCPCGRGLPIVDSIVGRMDHVFKDATFLKKARIMQKSKSITMALVVPRQGFGEEHMNQLRFEINNRLGSEMQVDFEIVDAVPRERKRQVPFCHLSGEKRVRKWMISRPTRGQKEAA